MSIDQKYINRYSDALQTIRGKYKVHCPVCRDIPTKKGKLKSNKRSAVLIPLEKCNSKYVFYCARCKAESRHSGMDLLSYLYRVNPIAAERYKAEKNGLEGFNFKPKFS